jgi:hypothetical protein
MIESHLTRRRLGFAPVSAYGKVLEARLEQLRANSARDGLRQTSQDSIAHAKKLAVSLAAGCLRFCAAAARGRIHRLAGRGCADDRAILRAAVRRALAIPADRHGRGTGQFISLADICRGRRPAAERGGREKGTAQGAGESHLQTFPRHGRTF